MKSFKQYFLEAKQVGILYHYTDVSGVIGIVETNTLQENGNKYVSFTRDKHFHKGDRYEGITGTSCRFIIDGDKLSENYKVQPFNYFWNREQGSSFYLHKDYLDEQEEIVKSPIRNFSKYVIKCYIDEHHAECFFEDIDDETIERPENIYSYYELLEYFNRYFPTEWAK